MVKMKKDTPPLYLLDEETGQKLLQPDQYFVHETKLIRKKRKIIRRRSVAKGHPDISKGQPNYNFIPGRRIYIIVRWHPDFQIYEFVHAVSSKRRAYAYLQDTFGTIIKNIGRTEFDKIYKVLETIAW